MASIWRVRLSRMWLKLRYQLFSRRYNRLGLEMVAGVPFIILLQVFNPVLLRTGQFMVQHFPDIEILRGAHVLDLGTGSGIGAVFAARHGASVVAVDINPHAARCAWLNVRLNRLEARVQVYQGDLFAAVMGQWFDVILFNPPFYEGQVKDNLDYAWRGEGVFERFAHNLADLLAPNGQVWLMLSSDGQGDLLLELLIKAGFVITVIKRQDMWNEILTLYRVRS